MAIVVDNIYTKGISGRVGDSLLYKQYGNKTVVSIFPRRSLKPPTDRQLVQRKKFALAVFKTRAWLAQKAKRVFLEGLERKWAAYSTYHAGIRYFMNQPAPEANNLSATQTTPPPNETVQQPVKLPKAKIAAIRAKVSRGINSSKSPSRGAETNLPDT